MGTKNVVADSLSCLQRVLGSEWTLVQEVVDELIVKWPATVDLFATALNYRLPVYFSPLNDPWQRARTRFSKCGMACRHMRVPLRSHSPGHQQAVVVQGDLSDTHHSVLAAKGMVSGAPESRGGSSVAPSFTSRLTQTAPILSPTPEPPRAEPSCVVTIQRFTRHLGLSRRVANQLSLCRGQSSRCLYQHRWECYRSWRGSRGHSISSPTINKIADFLLFLRVEKLISVSAIKGYCSTLVSIFKFRLPELLDSFVLRDLIHSFEIESPRRPVGPPSWDLVKVLTISGSTFEALASKPLRMATMKVSVLLALAMAKRVGKLQALSCRVASHGPDLSLAYLSEFVAKTESERNPLPRSFLVKSLEEFVGGFPQERLLCPVRAVRIYMPLTSTLSSHPRLLLVSPRHPSRALSKNALSFFPPPGDPRCWAKDDGSLLSRAYSVRAVAASAAFLRNWSISKVLEAATWRSNPVFA